MCTNMNVPTVKKKDNPLIFMNLHLGFSRFFSEDFNRRIFPSFTNALEKIERKQMREYLN